jgi:hypothetical protein
MGKKHYSKKKHLQIEFTKKTTQKSAVGQAADGLVFEQNTNATRNKF